jgi:hypothetical protein
MKKFKVNILALYRLYRKWVRYKKGIRIIKRGCPKCKNDLEVTPFFRMCSRFGKGCDYLLIKGRYVREEDFRVVRGESSCSSNRG